MSDARLRSGNSVVRPLASCLAVAVICAGCLGRGDTELLEANLRQQEDRIVGFERQVSTLQQQLTSARSEADQLRRELAAAGRDGRQEATEPLSRVAGIQFHSMMTGGRDADGVPGHDVITAVLTPHDKDGDLVKLGGELEIEVLDLSRPKDRQRLGFWKFPAEKARELWHSGFIASGYQLDLPLQAASVGGEVLLHGRLVTSDGRQFDTTSQVTLIAADAAASGSPAGLPSMSAARPLTQAGRTSGSSVTLASAESERAVRPVDRAGFAMVDETEPPQTSIRPVPTPVDLPMAEGLPAIRPGSPRPFPTPGMKDASSQPRPFPGDGRTSDRWTDETIPRLR
jgi:hypothetical protein